MYRYKTNPANIDIVRKKNPPFPSPSLLRLPPKPPKPPKPLEPPPPPRPPLLNPPRPRPPPSSALFLMAASYLSAMSTRLCGTTCSPCFKISINSLACFQSSRTIKVSDVPVRPARPVRPTRCTYSSMLRGKS
ncbi:hypothetical protein BpHYR1_025290 [Brachionus plicatilis]|uniref:Uncharacterized protein n=1 Tax=Brachionus plicatilis TaxID=10195 RepID=A0A3M7RGX4_BRAPC|nr:hypothetical protein BpHYR1_025290 [Brachionus plicatilis]